MSLFYWFLTIGRTIGRKSCTDADFFSAYAVLLQKESELVFIAVEHIDVYLASDAIDAAVGTQLPVGQAHIGLVFAIAAFLRI